MGRSLNSCSISGFGGHNLVESTDQLGVDRAVSVIIVNWNVKRLIVECLRSLFSHHADLSMEVTVVDNASADGSVERLRREFPHVRLIENPENVGFARANNQGIREATGRYVLLLNPDTVWIDDSLQRMVRFMDAHDGIGVLGPKLLNTDGKSIQFWGARRLPLPLDTFFEFTKLSALFPRNRLLGRQLLGYWGHADSRDVECVSGSCLFIRRKTIEDVGLLDEGYPLYFEDTDWCHRVKIARWGCYYLAEAQLIHIGQQSSLQNRGPSTIKAVRGVYRYYRKFYGRTTVLWIWLLLSSASLAKVLAWRFSMRALLVFLNGARVCALVSCTNP